MTTVFPAPYPATDIQGAVITDIFRHYIRIILIERKHCNDRVLNSNNLTSGLQLTNFEDFSEILYGWC